MHCLLYVCLYIRLFHAGANSRTQSDGECNVDVKVATVKCNSWTRFKISWSVASLRAHVIVVTAGRWVAKQSPNFLEILHLLNAAYRALACLTG